VLANDFVDLGPGGVSGAVVPKLINFVVHHNYVVVADCNPINQSMHLAIATVLDQLLVEQINAVHSNVVLLVTISTHGYLLVVT
jgi:hypothetical protein